jgi:hypothetical protein
VETFFEIGSLGSYMKSKFETTAVGDWDERNPSCTPAERSIIQMLTTGFCGMENETAESTGLPPRMGVHGRQNGRMLPFFGLFL